MNEGPRRERTQEIDISSPLTQSMQTSLLIKDVKRYLPKYPD